jgi:hypothetical protein
VTVGAREQKRRVGGISHRAAAWLAWSLGVASLALLMAGITVVHLRRPSEDIPFWLVYLLAIGFAAYPTVGALVASRRPKNAVGWLLCVVGLAISSSIFLDEYASYAQSLRSDSLPGAEVAAVLSTINPGPLLAIFVLLLFPDGQLPSRRWRPVVWLVGAGITLYVVQGILHLGHRNLLGVELPRGVLEAVSLLENVLLTVGIGGAVASVAVRLWHSQGEERQQIKWLLYAASVVVVGALGLVLPSPSSIFWGLTLLGFSAMPVAVGIAILRYRLYEIDIIINRTLVYGALTAMLAVVYFGGVATTQAIFRALTGQEQQPQLAVVVSTLAIAALFNPLRRRIQGFIDRRFYRRKYDARKTLEAFSAKLSHETNLDALSNDLVGVVRETVQPAHVSLWLRPDTASESKQRD